MKKRRLKRTVRRILILSVLLIVIIVSIFIKDMVVSALDDTIHVAKEEEQMDKDIPQIVFDGDIQGALHKLARYDDRVETIIANQDAYPIEVLQLLVKRPETIEFALGYLDHKSADTDIIIPLGSEVPKLYQWDVRWGYGMYGDDVMGITGCAPTVLSMASLHLTKRSNMNPYTVAQLAQKNGHYSAGEGTSWTIFQNTEALFHIKSKELAMNEATINKVLRQHGLVALSVGPGDFTSVGHFILIVGLDAQGNYIVRDPNSITNTEKTWTYNTLAKQTVNLWSLYV